MVAFATQVKRRRGTTAQNDAFTGAEGEIVVDTQKHTLRVHDGETQGGFEMATQADLDNKADTSYVDGLLATKADTDLGNIPTNYDYVVEKQNPTSANGYTWYRKYKSGWVEQGGTMTFPVAGTSITTKTINFPIEMANTNYTAQPTPIWAQPGAYYGWALQSKTTTSMSYNGYNTTETKNLSWFVCGMSLQ